MRQAAAYILDHFRTSLRRACRIVWQRRSMKYYQSCKDPRTALQARLLVLGRVGVRYGYPRLHVLPRPEGWSLSRVQAYRLCTQDHLQLRWNGRAVARCS